jgi:heptosyltransferase-2
MPSSHQINRILVRGTRWIGDAVMTVPALRALRQIFPHAHIVLSAGAWAEGLFLDADFIDELCLANATEDAGRLHAVWHEAQSWRVGDYELVVLFQNSFASALTASLARIPRRIGYATDGRGFLLTESLPVPAWKNERHEIFYYLNIIAEIEHRFTGKVFHGNRVPEAMLDVSPERQTAAQQLLRHHGVEITDSSARPLVILCPGSTNSRAKRWHAESYAALADRLIEDTNATILLIGAQAEREVSKEVAAFMQHRPVVLTGETTLAETVAVMSLASLVISNDTGPAHIAGALSRPTLVLFGPTNPTTTCPFSQTAEIIREPPLCAPCMLRDCPIDHRCMTRITPERVFDHANELLARTAHTGLNNSMEAVG